MKSFDPVNASDVDLMVSYQKGDADALGTLYERHGPQVTADCYSLTRDHETAHDVRNDTFVQVAEHAVGFVPVAEGSVRQWIRRIAHNLCVNHLRSAAVRRRAPLEDCPPMTAPEIAEDLGFNAAWLELAVEQLPEKQRVCIRLHYFEQRSYQQVASETGLSPKAVRTAIQNGRLRLRRMAEKRRANV